MRTDVKYGVIIAVCVVLLIAASLFVFRGEPDAGGKQAGSGDGTGNADQDTLVDLVPPSDTRTPEPRAETPTPAAITPGYGEDPASGTGTGDGTDLAAGTGTTEPRRAAPPGAGLDSATARLPDPGTDPGTDSALPGTRGAPAGPSGTYKVRKGDTYWDIAVREYGDGTLFKVIQDANPKIGASKLRPGMTIALPPKPAAAPVAVAARATSSAEGTVGIDPVTGKRFYVVKQGDRGFWGIAKFVYKAGKHYPLIEAANPGLKPRSLKPGSKVWVPVRAGEAPVVAAVGRRPPARPSRDLPALVAKVRMRTGAPTMAKLPDGSLFD